MFEDVDGGRLVRKTNKKNLRLAVHRRLVNVDKQFRRVRDVSSNDEHRGKQHCTAAHSEINKGCMFRDSTGSMFRHTQNDIRGTVSQLANGLDADVRKIGVTGKLRQAVGRIHKGRRDDHTTRVRAAMLDSIESRGGKGESWGYGSLVERT